MLLNECSSLIPGEQWHELSLLYGLVKSVEGGLPPVIKQFDEYMKQHGDILFKISTPGPEGPKSPDEFVNRIFSFHDKYIKLIKQVFFGDQDFIGAIDKICTFVINHKPNPKTDCPSLHLVRYLFPLLF